MYEITQPTERQNVMHHVAQLGPPAIQRGKGMLVMPEIAYGPMRCSSTK